VVTLAAVHEAFADWMAFPEDDGAGRTYELLDVAFATVLANRMRDDPLWMFLVAAPSSGKTEVLRALSGVPDVYPISSLTPQTFASGFEKRDSETSLLPQLTNKTMVMKDFGTVLAMHREARAEILAALREIYDGSYIKQWGNGKKFSWEGKVGLLAGCTPVIDRPGESALSTALGERFLLYRVRSAPPRILARQAMAQQARAQKEQRTALQTLVAKFLTSLPRLSRSCHHILAIERRTLRQVRTLARAKIEFDGTVVEVRRRG